MEKQPLGGGEQKIQEYIARIKAGESKDSILQGLPDSFVRGIENGLDMLENKKEVDLISIQLEDFNQKEKSETNKIATELELEQVRKRLGIKSKEVFNQKENNHKISELIESVSKGRRQVVVDLYKDLFGAIDNPESRKNLIKGLFQDVYNRYRIAEYPIDPDEEQTWEKALTDTRVDVNNNKPEWMYRGVFPEKDEETVTRGSFNVHVTPELISHLDDLIATGKIKANYKFGQPGTTASPTERHDSISIYFLEQPSEEVLRELSQIIKPYVRGDNLLGKKIDEGFFMSEVGSIKKEHIESFVQELRLKDSALSEAIKEYTSPQPGRGTALKMSEAQFYAIKDVAHAFGYDISYDKDLGFEIK